MSVVASFHLVRVRPGATTTTMARVPLDRRHLARVPGCRFVRLMGTGAGRTMSVGADLRRWACFAVWDDRAALAAFESADPVARRWAGAEERFTCTLEPLGAHGAWGGTSPIPEAASTPARDAGPVAVLTRAAIDPRRLRSFLRAVPDVDAVLDDTPGLLATVGMGEWPVVRQGTMSLWRSEADVRRFAYGRPEHAEVVVRTREEQWYTEEWFARFAVTAHSGTWGGIDPLDGAGERPAAG